jgi:hypothetical protein
MGKLNKRNAGLTLVLLVVIVAGYRFFSSDGDEVKLTATVQKGEFSIRVMATGELLAENSIEILGPNGMRRAGIWNTNITDLVPEGTYVDSGDYVATLDRTELANKLKEVSNELDKISSEFRAEKLDTALTLRQSRDDLINLKYSMEEKDLILKQSVYESPAVIRQAEIEKEKAKRAYNQALENYRIKQSQAEAKVGQVAASLRSQEMRHEVIQEVIDEFTIKAPQSGMIIYKRDWDGQKVEVGSQISSWSPVVATLPDLSSMISKTYINEIDVSKVSEDLRVNIQVDAFADKAYVGEIVSVANVGEQLPNSEAKVFEVNVLLDKVDTTLRPGMTTGNNILVNTFEDVVYVPIEAIFSDDSTKYAFVVEGFGHKKVEVETGEANENFIIITAGLNEGQEVLLNNPEPKSGKTEE